MPPFIPDYLIFFTREGFEKLKTAVTAREANGRAFKTEMLKC